jgi:Arc/MetJ family transcription regulator
MGLYICKCLADFLQIALEITSVPGEYTAVSLVFPSSTKENRNYLTKM